VTLGKVVKEVGKRGARAAGFDVRRRGPYDLDARRIQLAVRHAVDVVFDVGANQGQWARALRAAGYEGTIVSFEPLAAAFAGLRAASRRDQRWSALRLALGDATGRRTIHVAANSWSSSLLEMEDAHLAAEPASAYVAEQDVQVTTLDDVCRDRLGPLERAYLKLDVQGFEMDVLRGAERTLAQVDIVELELSITPLYRGQTLYREALDTFDRLGFGLVGLSEEFVDTRTGRLLQFDGVFERLETHHDGGEA